MKTRSNQKMTKLNQNIKRFITFLLTFTVIVSSIITIPVYVKAKSVKNGLVLDKNTYSISVGDKVSGKKILLKARLYKNNKLIAAGFYDHDKNKDVFEVEYDSKGRIRYFIDGKLYYLNSLQELDVSMLNYDSSNKNIVTVDSDGTITAMDVGKAEITITSKSDSKLKGSFTVNVKNGSGKIFLEKTRAVLNTVDRKETKIKIKKIVGLKSDAVTYESSNTKIASVNSKGVITAKKRGTTYITVKSKVNKKVKTLFIVTVTQPVLKVNVPNTTVSVQTGKKTSLSSLVSASPSNASNKKFSYKSSNKKIAIVNSKGVVTGIRAGKATITIKATDGYNAVGKVTVEVKSSKIVKVKKLNITTDDGKIYTARHVGTKGYDIDITDGIKPIQLKVDISPKNATDKKIYWTMDGGEGLTISKDGIITPTGKAYTVIDDNTGFIEKNVGQQGEMFANSVVIRAYVSDGSGCYDEIHVSIEKHINRKNEDTDE